MGIDRKHFSDTANWQTPQELPDLCRIRGHILNHVVNGRIYGEIRPHLSDEGGTISFRFSYSKPPLQQMPKHDDEIGALIRSALIDPASLSNPARRPIARSWRMSAINPTGF